ncbi:hypothetical protein NA57DRAFT_81104 [Rhizodiscina lignyota]|uniref:Uncharacterized protein n=1 Tax=Rhizodiscina lignyota TaxID=1504668 RepID=A0A9P4I7S3_9PEZI|nr:hypothetical protein NA57DRAFT_81104 [Rhizodiscina lignyota]
MPSLLKSLYTKDKKSKSSKTKSSTKPGYEPKSYPEGKYASKVQYEAGRKYYPEGKYYPISDSDSERTLAVAPSIKESIKEKETLSSKQEKLAKQQIAKHDVDCPAHPSNAKSSSKKSSSSKSKSKSNSKDEKTKSKEGDSKEKKKKLSRWFDLSSLATPIAVYNLPADFNGDDPNVYWDEEAKVWRYWYYTWCPIF